MFDKYDLINVHCFELASHNDWFRWFSITNLPFICNPSFNFMGGIEINK